MSKDTYDLVYNPKYITVHTEDRYLTKQVARVISKKVLQNIVTDRCDVYKAGECNACFTDKQELEYGCLLAWKLTTGKGKKLY